MPKKKKKLRDLEPEKLLKCNTEISIEIRKLTNQIYFQR